MSESKVRLRNGRTLTTHGPEQCLLHHCVIHNPSDHPLKNAKMDFLPDFNMIYRVCAHGIGHPDPDSLEVLKWRMQWMEVEAIASTHMSNCDGCCRSSG